MTEWQWLADEDSLRLLRRLADLRPTSPGTVGRWLTIRPRPTAPSDRKLRLFAAACFRLHWDSLGPSLQADVRTAEEAADRGIGGDWTVGGSSQTNGGHVFATATAAARAMIRVFAPPNARIGDDGRPMRGSRQQADVLRDIFGNPFRRAGFHPEWRTSTAVAIAQGMYDSRDFSAMPILADALQDAGCDSDDILNHCRQSDQHVRGCWVVDQVLGKA